jgi:hypothetical protein
VIAEFFIWKSFELCLRSNTYPNSTSKPVIEILSMITEKSSYWRASLVRKRESELNKDSLVRTALSIYRVANMVPSLAVERMLNKGTDDSE